MEKQKITITLEEYKMLRDKLEDYKLMYYIYQQLTYESGIEKEKIKVKQKIGFQCERES